MNLYFFLFHFIRSIYVAWSKTGPMLTAQCLLSNNNHRHILEKEKIFYESASVVCSSKEIIE